MRSKPCWAKVVFAVVVVVIVEVVVVVMVVVVVVVVGVLVVVDMASWSTAIDSNTIVIVSPPKKQVTPATSPLVQPGFSLPSQSSKLSSSPWHWRSDLQNSSPTSANPYVDFASGMATLYPSILGRIKIFKALWLNVYYAGQATLEPGPIRKEHTGKQQLPPPSQTHHHRWVGRQSTRCPSPAPRQVDSLLLVSGLFHLSFNFGNFQGHYIMNIVIVFHLCQWITPPSPSNKSTFYPPSLGNNVAPFSVARRVVCYAVVPLALQIVSVLGKPSIMKKKIFCEITS